MSQIWPCFLNQVKFPQWRRYSQRVAQDYGDWSLLKEVGRLAELIDGPPNASVIISVNGASGRDDDLGRVHGQRNDLELQFMLKYLCHLMPWLRWMINWVQIGGVQVACG